MTVAELINELAKYPTNSSVVVQGYEDGFDEVTDVRLIYIKPNLDPKWYYGRFDSTPDGGDPAVLLFGRARVEDSES